MWRRLWVGKRVEGEIENFPELDRAGQRVDQVRAPDGRRAASV